MPEARDAARQHAIVAATDVAQAAKLLALASSKLAPQEYAIARIAAANLTEGSEVMLSETSRGTYAPPPHQVVDNLMGGRTRFLCFDSKVLYLLLYFRGLL